MARPNIDNLQGQQLGDFVVGREIGCGGMGVVYEAQQVSLNRRVALKVLSGVRLSPKAVRRFQREAEAAAKLHHTNIVPVYATGEQDGVNFYAMELIEGPSLDHVIRQLRESMSPLGKVDTGPNPLVTTGPYVEGTSATPSGSGLAGSSPNSGTAYFDGVAAALAGVADALDHSHRQGVIHRDIKPSNLLLSPSGRLCVNDFGLARLLEQPGMTITGEMIGTPMYMSPEQITAGRIPLDHRTDIYSLGATLYELLTFEPPFQGEQRDQLLAQVIQKEPRPPRAVNPKVPVDLATICQKAMEKDPDSRYQTAGAMADDLRRYVNRFEILARRTGPLGRLKKWAVRNPSLSGALAGILFCAVVAGWLAYQAHRAERDRAVAAERHATELLQERRSAALELAILSARLEDFEGAREAIHSAEKLGCSAGQIRMLSGQLELYQGHNNEAIEHLLQATQLLPESVAAWAMLSIAYNEEGEATKSYLALREATRYPAVTPEDYLFLGHAESQLDPERSLATLDEAVRRRPSALSRIARIPALKMLALDSHDVNTAKQLMDDVRAVKMQYPENEFILSQAALAHACCYHVFNEHHLLQEKQVALAEGLAEAEALRRFPNSTRAMSSRWIFLDEIGQSDLAVADLRKLCDERQDLYSVFNYAGYLYKRGEFSQADQYWVKSKDDYLNSLMRLFVLPELGSDGLDRANRLYQELAGRGPGEWDLFNSQLVLRFLGRKEEAVEVSRKFLLQPERWPSLRQEAFKKALEYCASQRSAESLIASMEGKRGDLCNAYLCVALTALADGDRPTARRYLELGVGTRFFEFLPYDLCKMLLARMDMDPNWPPWVPPPP